MLSVHVVCACLVLLAQYFINCLGEFCPIYNFGALGDKDELVDLYVSWYQFVTTKR